MGSHEDHYQSPGLPTVYVDPDTLRREGHLVTIWQLTDYKSVQGNVGLERFALDPPSLPTWMRHRPAPSLM